MEWTDKGGGDFEMPEAGTYGATCYRVIDVGTQTSTYEGKETHKRQVILAWEIDEKMSDGKPFVVSAFYTASLNEKAKLRQHMAAWRGRDFDAKELAGFNPKQLLNAPCMLTLTINEKGRVKVGGVSKLPKGMTVPPLVNPQLYLSLEPGKFDPAAFNQLSEGLQAIIKKSPEYNRISTGGQEYGFPDGGVAGLNDDDSIPF